MKKSRFNRFSPSCPALVLPLASSLLLSITAMGGTINEMTTGDNFGIGSNWSLLSAPVGNANLGSHTDLLFTTSSTTLIHAGTMLYGESYNVTNGTSYIIKSTRVTDPATFTNFRIGSLSSGTSFTNAVVAAVDPLAGLNDLVYLSNNSNLTFDGVNGVEGGLAPTLNLRLTTGNFNISEGSTLTIGMNITPNGTNAIVINGNGTTVLSGNNTYTGSTTVRGGTLEIAGTNIASSYVINGLVNPSEPVLKLSNVNALPATAVFAGSNSLNLDGIVDLSVAGAYTFDYYNRGNITFTASSGSPTTLNFTGVTLASRITSGGNSGRKFSNLSSNLSIVFDSTLDIGGDVDANVTIDSTGSTTVTGGVISTGTNVRSLTKDGIGSLTLNGASTYGGTTTVSAGVLRLGDVLALPGGIAATGGTSNLIFSGTTGVIGLTAATGDFLRAVGPGADQVTANPNATAGEGESMGFAAYGGDRVVDFGASIQLAQASYAGDGLTLGASDSDSKVTVVNDINLANFLRSVRVRNGAAAVDAELSGVISSPGGTLVKIGGGTLALTGANTYGSAGGGTSVLDGTLAVDGDSLSDTSELVIDGGIVDLTGAETVDTLFFGVTQQSVGTYSSDGAGGTIASANFTGSGTLIVTSGPVGGDPFTTWAETIHSLAGGDALPGADPDNDGLKNTLEFVLGGDPNTNDSPPVAPSVTDGGSAITLTFNRSDESELQPVAVKVQVSADLVTWNPADDITIGAVDGSGPNGVTYTVAENAGDPDTVVVTIPKNSATQKFVRVDAVIP